MQVSLVTLLRMALVSRLVMVMVTMVAMVAMVAVMAVVAVVAMGWGFLVTAAVSVGLALAIGTVAVRAKTAMMAITVHARGAKNT